MKNKTDFVTVWRMKAGEAFNIGWIVNLHDHHSANKINIDWGDGCSNGVSRHDKKATVAVPEGRFRAEADLTTEKRPDDIGFNKYERPNAKSVDDGDLNVSHTYKLAGDYEIRISSNVVDLRFCLGKYADTVNAENLIDIKQWGAAEWFTMKHMFSDCVNMTMSATDAPNLLKDISIKGMFAGCTKFNSSLDHWDISQVSDAGGMLIGADSFDQTFSQDWVDLSDKTDDDEYHIFGYPIEEYLAGIDKDTFLDVLLPNNSGKAATL